MLMVVAGVPGPVEGSADGDGAGLPAPSRKEKSEIKIINMP